MQHVNSFEQVSIIVTPGTLYIYVVRNGEKPMLHAAPCCFRYSCIVQYNIYCRWYTSQTSSLVDLSRVEHFYGSGSRFYTFHFDESGSCIRIRKYPNK